MIHILERTPGLEGLVKITLDGVSAQYDVTALRPKLLGAILSSPKLGKGPFSQAWKWEEIKRKLPSEARSAGAISHLGSLLHDPHRAAPVLAATWKEVWAQKEANLEDVEELMD